ncbi:hypothetical protein bcere0029_58040 [Bacillus cereus AH1272]|nr:hypothetical protein bcere0029_58040 [Bacillus cereus AH1272]EEL90283.1 hypothetical protein bcere0030_57900 [Bacillus cereus AH1273]
MRGEGVKGVIKIVNIEKIMPIYIENISEIVKKIRIYQT